MVVAEVVQDGLRLREAAITGGDRRDHAGFAEPDDVGALVPGDVREYPHVPVEAPAGRAELS